MSRNQTINKGIKRIYECVRNFEMNIQHLIFINYFLFFN